MSKLIHTKFFTFEFGDDIFDVNLIAEYEWDNDGIGSYEFWGMPGFDSGTDYVVINDIKPSFNDDYTEKQKEFVLKEIADNFNKYSELIADEILNHDN